MNYELTSSEKLFINSFSDAIWNQGVIFVTEKIYSYEIMNDAFNDFISFYDTLSLHLICERDKCFLKYNNSEKVSYPHIRLDSFESVIEKSKEFTNEIIDCENSLFRCIIFNTPTQSGYIICAHHIIIDGFSAKIMIDYLENRLKGIDCKPAIQSYEERIKAEENYLNSKRYQKDRNFWSEQFSLKPECSIFEEKKTSLDYASDEVDFRISAELFGKIKKFCTDNAISVQSFFNTVYSAYIFRTLGTDFFTVGVPVLNRTTEAELNTIGLYMHIVPLLIRVSDCSFLKTAVEIEDAQMNLFRHQKFTQHDIKELLKQEGKPCGSLFDVAADYQEFEENENYEFQFVYSNALSVPLEIHMQSFGKDKHNLKIRYRTSMFSNKEIQTMMNSFIAIIEDAVENPEKKISRLNMLTAEEKQKVLFDFNNTAVEYDKDTCVYQLFRQQADRHPEKTAVIFKNEHLSYGELSKLVDSYAGKLKSFSVGMGDVVAVHLERSHKLIAFQLAVLKIGAVFLPLDKRFPAERLKFACEDCKASLFITDEAVQFESDTKLIRLDELESVNEDGKANAVINKDCCYIIYTSGSTGKPKGCMLTGQGLLNFCRNNNTLETLNKLEKCVFACVNSVSFDYFIAETLLPLTNGFTAVVLDEKESTVQRLFSETVINKGINVVMTTPTRLKIYFGDKHKSDALSQLRCICTSGEPLTADLLLTMYEKAPYARVYNPIGPSECSVWDIGGELDREKGVDIHIGKPIANVQIYIVDRYMNPVAIGVTGEICIAGDGVGAGYLNRPELTAERFIDNPFGEGKLYKTGDLGYWREDGNIAFVGRNDFQVKIRGLRIELGEIENAVASVDGVELSVAVVRTDKNGVQYICVFYTGQEKPSSELKNLISQKLPSYMLPHVCVHLEELPVTSSGKLDRKALPEISFVKEDAYEQPVNESERLVCGAFERVLGLKRVGRNGDFFELGGTSLSVISLLSEEGFEKLSASELMQNPVVKDLAVLLNNSRERCLDYLEPLYVAEKAESAFVLFPFGGGAAEGFSSLVKEIKHKHGNVSVYFIRYLHSAAECERAAEEIKEVFSGVKVIFYSHCAGAAVAMKVLEKLEKDSFTVTHFYAGAIIPSARKDGKSLWTTVPDFVIKNAFLKAGAGLDGISVKKQKEIIARFRMDTDYAYRVFFEAKVKFQTPVTVIISKKDIFTYNYRQAEAQWKKYAENLNGIKFINAKGHYFQTDNAQRLTEILFG